MNGALREYDWAALDETARASALERPALRLKPELPTRVRDIIAEVRRDGDAALLRLTEQLDGVRLAGLRVTAGEAAAAQASLTDAAKEAINTAITNLQRFHRGVRSVPWEGR